MCFNPHPVRRPDATNQFNQMYLTFKVSILIRSEDRMQHNERAYNQRNCKVSILIRSEDRMQPISLALHEHKPSFNPHPVRRPDATSQRKRARDRMRVSILIRSEDRMQLVQTISRLHLIHSFNPHPVRRPDATNLYLHLPSASVVSILIRSEDRMQHVFHNLILYSFFVSILIRSEDRMQRKKKKNKSFASCFNPHPVRRPDATLCALRSGFLAISAGLLREPVFPHRRERQKNPIFYDKRLFFNKSEPCAYAVRAGCPRKDSDLKYHRTFQIHYQLDSPMLKIFFQGFGYTINPQIVFFLVNNLQ